MTGTDGIVYEARVDDGSSGQPATALYPLTLAAVAKTSRNAWADPWDIGDALLEECGTPSIRSVRDKSQEVEAGRCRSPAG